MKQGNVKSLPKGWETKKLVDVCIVERGSSPRPIEKYQTDSSDGVNWIKIGDTKNVDKYIYTTREKITKEGAQKSRYVKEGDFILSNSMSFGKPFIMKTDGYIHDGWFALRLHNFIDTEYFYHLLSSPLVNEQFHKLASGSVVKNISGDLVKKVVLPIPPLQEQQRIVAILDEAFSAIDKAKANTVQNLKNARELFESELQRVFSEKGDGWEEKRLSDVTNIQRGSSPRPKGDPRFFSKTETEFNWITISDISSYCMNNILLKTREWLTETGSKQSRFVDKNEFIIAVSGSTTGKCCITGIKGFIYDGLAVAKVKKNLIDPIFLLNYMLSLYSTINNSKAGAAFPNINTNYLNNLPISLPPLKDQQAIVSKLDALREQTKKLEAVYERKLQDLEELKKSVLSKAFSGEL